MKTSERLVKALREAGLDKLAERAWKGEFSDFESPHAMPKVMLVQELNKAMESSNVGMDSPINRLKRAVLNGEYDDTKEEAEAWFAKSMAPWLFKRQ